MKTAVINLKDFLTPGSKVFTGRDKGIEVRDDSKIDKLEVQKDAIEIIVPSNIRSINPSFLEEFLFNVVKKLGEDEFRRKFTFTCEGRYLIDEDLSDAIDRILREKNALV